MPGKKESPFYENSRIIYQSCIIYFMENKVETKQRLLSLDILRGFDLFMLVFFQPVLVALGNLLHLPFMDPILSQFDHEVWYGFRAWDLVMPLFLFMTGIAMPFSFSKYRLEVNKKPIYRRIFRRVLLLFLLGMVVQGNLLGLDPHYFRFYSNTLQAIAVGYLITAVILLHCSDKGQFIAAIVLMLLYWVPVSFFGDYTPEGNFAMKIDRLILGRFMDGVYWTPDGAWSFSPDYHYTWILSSLTFGVTVLMGAFAGQILKNGKDKMKNLCKLILIGVVCILASLLWNLQMPIIKRLWTCSMTLFSGGICFLLMALFYYVIDCLHYTKGLLWLRFYGMNSITAYVLGEVVNFRCIAVSVFHGLEQYMDGYYTVWITFCNYFIVLLILKELYRRGIFLKV